MNKIGILVLGAAFAASFCYGQGSVPAPAAQATPAAVGHGSFPVKVVKTLDSSKLKSGDTVEVETAGSFKLPDGTLVPKGSKLTGHVTLAKARAKGDSDSQLAVTFDKLDIVNGKELTIKGTVQAVAPPPDQADPGMPASTMARGGGSNGLGGATPLPTPEYQPPDVKTSSSGSSNSQSQTNVGPTSVGVQGMHGIELSDGVLSSKGKNVKLGDGVRLVVHVDIFS
jgi:hypothetical protein